MRYKLKKYFTGVLPIPNINPIGQQKLCSTVIINPISIEYTKLLLMYLHNCVQNF
jgi:hypothetical protein